MPFKTLESAEIVELTLSQGCAVPSIEGRFFCSRRDPMREALSWLQAHERLLKSASRVIVLGLGAGFHLENWKFTKDLTVVELRPQLIERWTRLRPQAAAPIRFRSELNEAALDQTVIEFRPAWNGLESEYETLSRTLRGVSRISLQNQAEKKDLWILSEALQNLELPENVELTIKDIVQCLSIENQSEEARMWRALRELVL